jgi:hypothetical protein
VFDGGGFLWGEVPAVVSTAGRPLIAAHASPVRRRFFALRSARTIDDFNARSAK